MNWPFCFLILLECQHFTSPQFFSTPLSLILCSVAEGWLLMETNIAYGREIYQGDKRLQVHAHTTTSKSTLFVSKVASIGSTLVLFVNQAMKTIVLVILKIRSFTCYFTTQARESMEGKLKVARSGHRKLNFMPTEPSIQVSLTKNQHLHSCQSLVFCYSISIALCS